MVVHRFLVFGCLIFIASGCTLEFNIDEMSDAITGRLILSEKVSSSSFSSLCENPKAYLYSIDRNGQKNSNHFGVGEVQADGFYAIVPLNVSLMNDNINYIIEVKGCSQSFSRFVTGQDEQNISYGSSLLTFVLDSEAKNKVNSTHTHKMRMMIEKLSDSYDYSTAYQKLINNNEEKKMFQEAFNVPPSVLLHVPPRIISENIPTSLDEKVNYSFSVAMTHWYPTYEKAYIWKLENVDIGNNSQVTWEPGADSQGVKALTLYWGQKNGAGDLDLTKPFQSKSFVLNVKNTIKATPPELVLLSDSYTQSTSVSLEINTGPSKIYCESFKKLAITSSSIIQPSPSAFTIECNQENTQVLPLQSMTGVDGSKSFNLWAMDSAGNISQTPRSVFLTLDREAPTINSMIINDGASYAGTTIATVKINLSENLTSLDLIKVRLSAANVGTNDCQSEYADDNWIDYTNSSTPIPFQITNFDGIKKICVWAKDLANNISMITPSQGVEGVNFDTIIYEVGNPPVINQFTVTRNSGGNATSPGDGMTISWDVSDVESLDNQPINISYTTDNLIWKDIVTDLDISDPNNRTWLGSLSGNPTSGTDVVSTWVAPSSNYFRLKAVARDISGNTSIPILSNPFNVGAWSVYAGSKDRGVGGGALAAAFYAGSHQQSIAFNPVNGDLYVVDYGYAIKKVSAVTGKVSNVLLHGTNNLPASGFLDATSRADTSSLSLAFDNKGHLYISTNLYYNARIYQINLENNSILHYAGGGVENDGGVLSTSLWATNSFTFDESDSMYLTVQCANHVYPYMQGKRLIKIEQNLDGTPGNTSRIIGDCNYAAPNYGGDAYSSSFGPVQYSAFVNLAVWDNGDKIYFEGYSQVRWKIVSGKVYSVNLNNSCSGGGITYNPIDGYLYRTNATCGVEKFLPNLSGNGGETAITVFQGNSSSLGCTGDGIDASNACTKVDKNLVVFNGLVYFTDGFAINSSSYYRVRYVGGDQKIRTLAGSLPFYGDGSHKNVIRGALAGIYYKKNTEPNQAAFPPGLYFMDKDAGVLGYIDPNTEMTSTLWGNQSRVPTGFTPGQVISKDLSLGTPYGGGSLYPLTFDNTGLPWLRSGNQLYKINSSKEIEAKTNGGLYWDTLADGADPTTSSMYVYSLENLTFKDQALFRLGVAYANIPAGLDPNISIRMLDFDLLNTTKIMGGNFVYTDYSAASPDVGAGQVVSAPLLSSCYFNNCYIYYDENLDYLFFSEGNQIRYITSPSNTVTATLNTLAVSPGGVVVSNITLNSDSSQLWYLSGGSALYCLDISSGKSWCDNSTNHFQSMIGAGFYFTKGPNQLTWIDDGNLLLSTYSGEILQYVLPTGP